jgi:hypothetical protein
MGDSQVDANHELWGTWTSRLDGTLMELSPTSFHLRFPYRGMVRDNYARVLRHDPDAHHVYLEYVRVLDDSIEQPLPDNPRSCMTYMITEGILRKWIGTGTCAGPEKITFEEFVK